jgi:hypothetical protein
VIDPQFKKVEQSYARLRKQFDAGKLNRPQFESAVRDLMFERDGRHWMMGATSAKWYVSQGQTWVEAKPLSAAAPVVAAKLDQATAAAAPAAMKAPQTATAPHAAPAPAPAVAKPASTPSFSAATRMTMRRWGITMMVTGAGAAVLPMIGMQMRLFSIFGDNQQGVGLVAAATGGILLFISREPSNASAAAPTAATPAAAVPASGYAGAGTVASAPSYASPAPAGAVAAAAAKPNRFYMWVAIAIGVLLVLSYVRSEMFHLQQNGVNPMAPFQSSTTNANLPPCPPNYQPQPSTIGLNGANVPCRMPSSAP